MSKRFIRLTDDQSRPLLLDVGSVQGVSVVFDNVTCVRAGGWGYTVAESFDDVAAMLIGGASEPDGDEEWREDSDGDWWAPGWGEAWWDNSDTKKVCVNGGIIGTAATLDEAKRIYAEWRRNNRGGHNG